MNLTPWKNDNIHFLKSPPPHNACVIITVPMDNSNRMYGCTQFYIQKVYLYTEIYTGFIHSFIYICRLNMEGLFTYLRFIYTQMFTHKVYTQCLYTQGLYTRFIYTRFIHTRFIHKVYIHKVYTQGLYTRFIHKVYTQSLYTQGLYTRFIYTRFIHKVYTHKVYTQGLFIHKGLFIYETFIYTQMFYTQRLHFYRQTVYTQDIWHLVTHIKRVLVRILLIFQEIYVGYQRKIIDKSPANVIYT